MGQIGGQTEKAQLLADMGDLLNSFRYIGDTFIV